MTPESEAIARVSELMALAARTAPKGKGVDTIHIRVVRGNEKKRLASAMKKYGEEHGIKFFLRDAKNVEDCECVLIVGCEGRITAGIDCGGCGYPSCAAMLSAAKGTKKKKTAFSGPNCAIRMADLGIAVGSAVKTASVHNADNRVMYSAGVAALTLKMPDPACTVAYGIPLSATGKNMFFDRTR
jgi:uncharacterized ferredoxin-like protein